MKPYGGFLWVICTRCNGFPRTNYEISSLIKTLEFFAPKEDSLPEDPLTGCSPDANPDLLFQFIQYLQFHSRIINLDPFLFQRHFPIAFKVQYNPDPFLET